MSENERDILTEGERDAILDSIADGVFTVDGEWRITFLNKAAERITGVATEEALGRPCCEVLRASVCESACPLRETLESGRPVLNRTVYIVNSEGERIPISISTAVLRDREGGITGGVETFRDLSVVEELRKELEGRWALGDIVSRSPKMQRLFDLLPEVARSGSTVLVLGESGTGKELLARAIHNLSGRAEGPFVAVNCAALPDALLESELFGHVAGAFTDARKDRKGRFAAADGGTIFLDEIGDISPALQVRLLRVLQEKSYEPLGSNETVRSEARVITATNRELGKMVEEGVFRRDLYYRINVVSLELPPLGERKEDIPLLAERFIARFNRVQGRNVAGVSDGAMEALMAYDYPGNIRELENAIERAFVLCGDGMINVRHLPESIAGERVAGEVRVEASGTLGEMERLWIEGALRRNNWNRSAAARELGIHKTTLFRKIKSYGMSLPRRGAGREQ